MGPHSKKNLKSFSAAGILGIFGLAMCSAGDGK